MNFHSEHNSLVVAFADVISGVVITVVVVVVSVALVGMMPQRSSNQHSQVQMPA